MPVHGADDREKNMETGLAVLFGVCCSVTDCKRRKITLSVLLAGAAAGCILSGIRIWQGTESAWEMLAAILPAVCLESVVILTAGKVGSGDAGIRVAAGVESMRFNFVHGLSADWCCSWLRNGDRCASSEQ